VRGGAAPYVLHSVLGDLLRESNLTAKLPGCVALFGAGDYYLRATPARIAAAAALAGRKLDVDHTVECQVMAHCLAQTQEWHALLAQAVHTAPCSLKHQPTVLGAALRPLVRAHNGGEEVAFFNLRPLTPEVNKQKGALFKAFLHSESKTEGAGETALDLRATLRRYLREGDACGGSEHVADSVTAAIFRNLRETHALYVDKLQEGLPPAGAPSRVVGARSAEDARFEALGETLKELAARIDDAP
jgi:hypothetical protein